MGLDLPAPFRWLFDLLGTKYPAVDEDKIAQFSRQVGGIGLRIDQTGSNMVDTVRRANLSGSGPAMTAYTDNMRDVVDNGMPGMADGARTMADGIYDAALQAEYAKGTAVLNMAIMGPTIMQAIADAPETFGASMAVAEAGIAALRATIPKLFTQMVEKVATSTAMAEGSDVAVQGYQTLIKRDRAGFDANLSLSTVESAVAGGIVQGGIDGALMKFVPKYFKTASVGITDPGKLIWAPPKWVNMASQAGNNTITSLLMSGIEGAPINGMSLLMGGALGAGMGGLGRGPGTKIESFDDSHMNETFLNGDSWVRPNGAYTDNKAGNDDLSFTIRRQPGSTDGTQTVYYGDPNVTHPDGTPPLPERLGPVIDQVQANRPEGAPNPHVVVLENVPPDQLDDIKALAADNGVNIVVPHGTVETGPNGTIRATGGDGTGTGEDTGFHLISPDGTVEHLGPVYDPRQTVGEPISGGEPPQARVTLGNGGDNYVSKQVPGEGDTTVSTLVDSALSQGVPKSSVHAQGLDLSNPSDIRELNNRVADSVQSQSTDTRGGSNTLLSDLSPHDANAVLDRLGPPNASSTPHIDGLGPAASNPHTVHSADPTREPSTGPAPDTTREPSAGPAPDAIRQPSAGPAADPTREPLTGPADHPTGQPTNAPFTNPAKAPAGEPLADPARDPIAELDTRLNQDPAPVLAALQDHYSATGNHGMAQLTTFAQDKVAAGGGLPQHSDLIDHAIREPLAAKTPLSDEILHTVGQALGLDVVVVSGDKPAVHLNGGSGKPVYVHRVPTDDGGDHYRALRPETKPQAKIGSRTPHPLPGDGPKPTRSKPTGSKPTGPKPVGSKPVGSKPVGSKAGGRPTPSRGPISSVSSAMHHPGGGTVSKALLRPAGGPQKTHDAHGDHPGGLGEHLPVGFDTIEQHHSDASKLTSALASMDKAKNAPYRQAPGFQDLADKAKAVAAQTDDTKHVEAVYDLHSAIEKFTDSLPPELQHDFEHTELYNATIRAAARVAIVELRLGRNTSGFKVHTGHDFPDPAAEAHWVEQVQKNFTQSTDNVLWIRNTKHPEDARLGASVNAMAKKPDPDYFTVALHGSPGAVHVGNGHLSVKETAALIKADPHWSQNQRPIRLFSCYTGMHDQGFAHALSKELGVDVKAPNDKAWADRNGNTHVSENMYKYDDKGVPRPAPSRKEPETGAWHQFSPDQTHKLAPNQNLGRTSALTLLTRTLPHSEDQIRTFPEPAREPLRALAGALHTSDTLFDRPQIDQHLNKMRDNLSDLLDDKTLQTLITHVPSTHGDLNAALHHLSHAGPQQGSASHSAHSTAGSHSTGSQHAGSQHAAAFDALGDHQAGESGWHGPLDTLSFDTVQEHKNDSAVLAGALTAMDQQPKWAPFRQHPAYPGLVHKANAVTAQTDDRAHRAAVLDLHAALESYTDSLPLSHQQRFEHSPLYHATWQAHSSVNIVDRRLGRDTSGFKVHVGRDFPTPAFRDHFVEQVAKDFTEGTEDVLWIRSPHHTQDTNLRRAVDAIAKAADKRYFTVALHGSPGVVHVGNFNLSVKELAALISADKHWSQNRRPIRLSSCYTGMHDQGFAHELAKELGVDVVAPDDIAWSNIRGEVRVSEKMYEYDDNGVPQPPRRKDPDTGALRRFSPDGTTRLELEPNQHLGHPAATTLLTRTLPHSENEIKTWPTPARKPLRTLAKALHADDTLYDRPQISQHMDQVRTNLSNLLDDKTLSTLTAHVPNHRGDLREALNQYTHARQALGSPAQGSHLPHGAANPDHDVAFDHDDPPGALLDEHRIDAANLTTALATMAAPGFSAFHHTPGYQGLVDKARAVAAQTDARGHVAALYDLHASIEKFTDSLPLQDQHRFEHTELGRTAIGAYHRAATVELRLRRNTAGYKAHIGRDFVDAAARSAWVQRIGRHLTESTPDLLWVRSPYHWHDLKNEEFIKALSADPRYFTVALHGSPGIVHIGDHNLSVKDLAALIVENEHWSQNPRPIRLHSCYTGMLPDGYAHELSKELGVDVIAPSDISWADYLGNLHVSENLYDYDEQGAPRTVPDLSKDPETGVMRRFSPDGTSTLELAPNQQLGHTAALTMISRAVPLGADEIRTFPEPVRETLHALASAVRAEDTLFDRARIDQHLDLVRDELSYQLDDSTVRALLTHVPYQHGDLREALYHFSNAQQDHSWAPHDAQAVSFDSFDSHGDHPDTISRALPPETLQAFSEHSADSLRLFDRLGGLTDHVPANHLRDLITEAGSATEYHQRYKLLRQLHSTITGLQPDSLRNRVQGSLFHRHLSDLMREHGDDSYTNEINRHDPPLFQDPGEAAEFIRDHVVKRPDGTGIWIRDEQSERDMRLRESSASLPADPGWFTIDMHGSGLRVFVGKVGLHEADLHNLLQHIPEWKDDPRPIRLASCDSGEFDDGIAQRLADLIGYPVKAPNTSVWTNHSNQLYATALSHAPDGRERVRERVDGAMRVFPPRTLNPDGSLHSEVRLDTDYEYLGRNPALTILSRAIAGSFGDALAGADPHLRGTVNDWRHLMRQTHGTSAEAADLSETARNALDKVLTPDTVQWMFRHTRPGTEVNQALHILSGSRRRAQHGGRDPQPGNGRIRATATKGPGRTGSTPRHGGAGGHEISLSATEGHRLDADAITAALGHAEPVVKKAPGFQDVADKARAVAAQTDRRGHVDAVYDLAGTLEKFTGSLPPGWRRTFERTELYWAADKALASVAAVELTLRRHTAGFKVRVGHDFADDAARDTWLARFEDYTQSSADALWIRDLDQPVDTALRPLFEKLAGSQGSKEFSVLLHGTPHAVKVGGNYMSVKDLAAVIRDDQNWGGRPIRMHSCLTGMDDHGFAHELSKELGVDVIAPNDVEGFNFKGETYVTEKLYEYNDKGIPKPPRGKTPWTGALRRFSPDGSVRLELEPGERMRVTPATTLLMRTLPLTEAEIKAWPEPAHGPLRALARVLAVDDTLYGPVEVSRHLDNTRKELSKLLDENTVRTLSTHVPGEYGDLREALRHYSLARPWWAQLLAGPWFGSSAKPGITISGHDQPASAVHPAAQHPSAQHSAPQRPAAQHFAAPVGDTHVWDPTKPQRIEAFADHRQAASFLARFGVGHGRTLHLRDSSDPDAAAAPNWVPRPWPS
ncbi:hypothetical protein KGQ20_25640 [Catenulispora sp. NF23]|uniref:hypothetical protein n=1 Tax=Catenulispora pinistramenti TaxID=2705254 RepID=UPI001BA7DCAB|nr:hypothetical protein [Catenulispora pinistramenti]MBS2536151.1 hypothetical protein [Catenulispora pinistramenti]